MTKHEESNLPSLLSPTSKCSFFRQTGQRWWGCLGLSTLQSSDTSTHYMKGYVIVRMSSLPVVLFQTARPVHDAGEVDAVVEAEQVEQLMDSHLMSHNLKLHLLKLIKWLALLLAACSCFVLCCSSGATRWVWECHTEAEKQRLGSYLMVAWHNVSEHFEVMLYLAA